MSKNKRENFYTSLSCIEKEMKYYRDYFKGKIIYCNCDDTKDSNFFKYFSLNFERLELKALVTTSYVKNGKGTIFIYKGDLNNNKIIDEEEIDLKGLESDGDFRSPECLKILQRVDIVVTNPPSTLINEFIEILLNYKKDFIILGNLGDIQKKNIFFALKENKLWIGKSLSGTTAIEFISKNKENNIFANNSIWFTNLKIREKLEVAPLIRKYSPLEYSFYDKSNIINVDKIKDIPYDYNEVIGVPITVIRFLGTDGLLHFEIPIDNNKEKLFRILGISYSGKCLGEIDCPTKINEKETYIRLFIQATKEKVEVKKKEIRKDIFDEVISLVKFSIEPLFKIL